MVLTKGTGVVSDVFVIISTGCSSITFQAASSFFSSNKVYTPEMDISSILGVGDGLPSLASVQRALLKVTRSKYLVDALASNLSKIFSSLTKILPLPKGKA